MASATYTARAIVLRKTKLGESDLIVTLLAQDGSQLRAVAKGARKPTSPFAARLELYSTVDLLCSEGRNLDIVKEARIATSHERLRRDLEHTSCAAPMAELLDRVTQEGLTNPRLFSLTKAALDALDAASAPLAPAICAAHLLKALAFAGFRPSLSSCAVCGSAVQSNSDKEAVPLSVNEGGVVCPSCRPSVETQGVPIATLTWCRVLMGSTFSEILKTDIPVAASFAVLHFCQQWTHAHVGANLKSLNFLFTCGLF